MFQTCLRRRLRVACNRRGFDCAYVAERILVELPSRVVRRRARLRHSAASHRRCDFKLTACAIFYVAGGECHHSSTVSAGSVRRRLDLTGRGQVDTLTVSIYGLDPAFSMASTRRRLGVFC